MSEFPDPNDDKIDITSYPIGPSTRFGRPGSRDRLAAVLIGWPSTLLLSLWCLGLLASWAPGYLTWPWFTDHDHFAMIAESWSRGRLLYRDLFTTQPPGEIYLFRAVGECAGWGNSVAFYTVDLMMVLFFGALAIFWSLRRFGRILPGLIGLGVFLSYYSSQTFAVAGQRGWHGAFLATAGFFFIDLLPGRLGRILSGLAIGAAISISPQFVLAAPGMLLAVGVVSRRAVWSWRWILIAWSEWCAAAGLILLFAFLPVIWAGLFPDFLRCFRSIAYGAGLAPAVGMRFMRIVSNMRNYPDVLLILAILIVATIRGPRSERGEAAAIIVLQLSMFCFSVISPENHIYYRIPVFAFYGLTIAYLSGSILNGQATNLIKLLFVILMIIMAVASQPMQSLVKRVILEMRQPSAAVPREESYGSRLAMDYLIRRHMPDLQPSGRREPSGRYPWKDYRATIEYLRQSTTMETPVASLLVECNTAVTGAIPRISPLPCDSISLCYFPSWIQADIEALRSAEGCVVVWDTGIAEGQGRKIAPLFEFVRTNYHSEARFGNIEVWRRNLPPN